jgi:hypothetical protein
LWRKENSINIWPNFGLERWVGYAGYVLGGVVGAAVVIAVATELIAKHTWDQVLLGLCGTCRAMSCSTGATSA